MLQPRKKIGESHIRTFLDDINEEETRAYYNSIDDYSAKLAKSPELLDEELIASIAEQVEIQEYKRDKIEKIAKFNNKLDAAIPDSRANLEVLQA